MRLKKIKAIQSTEIIIKIFQSINFQQPQAQYEQFKWLTIPINASNNPKLIENVASKWKILLSPTNILTALID